jgi:hypothetical protein
MMTEKRAAELKVTIAQAWRDLDLSIAERAAERKARAVDQFLRDNGQNPSIMEALAIAKYGKDPKRGQRGFVHLGRGGGGGGAFLVLFVIFMLALMMGGCASPLPGDPAYDAGTVVEVQPDGGPCSSTGPGVGGPVYCPVKGEPGVWTCQPEGTVCQ